MPICGPAKLECQMDIAGDSDFYIHADTNVYKTGGNGVF
jgi:hypothetical protein